MSSKKGVIIRFSLLQLCLIIPMLLFSVMGMVLTVNKMSEIDKYSIELQLENVVEQLQSNYQNYNEESIVITNMQELFYDKMTGNATYVYDGINVLKKKLCFDNRISDVFLDYGTNYFYSSGGVTRKDVYFQQTLGCRTESMNKGMEIVNERQEGANFLFRTNTDGYLMYTFQPRRTEGKEVSVNFIQPFSQIQNIFGLTDNKQWYLLEDTQGSSIAVGCDEQGKSHILSTDEVAARRESNKYDIYSQTISSQSMTLYLYSEKVLFARSNGMLTIQLLNMALIVTGTILSALLSWRYSRKRMNEIQYLEELAKGEREYTFSSKHVYNQLQDIIISSNEKSKMSEMNLIERTELLHAKNTYMILYGLLNRSEMEDAFRNMGIDPIPKRFFIGTVCVAGKQNFQLPPMLTKGLHANIEYNSLEIAVFLYDFQTGEDNLVRRKSIAQAVKQHLLTQGINKVKVGMSQVYTDPMLINCAYNEAVGVLDQLLSGKIDDFCGCWEEVLSNNRCFLPNNAELQFFIEALQEKNYEEAKVSLQSILNNYRGKDCTKENQIYIRYMLLQCLIDHIKTAGNATNAILVNECLNVNVNDESSFIHQITNIIKKCTSVNNVDYLTKMIEYIENNYQRSELTYEEVAAAGGISKSYVSRIFKAQLGVTYIEYLTSVRMEKARTLLRTTDNKVSDIMVMVGYVNPSTFQRCFKDEYGMTTTEYRKREQKYKKND